MYPRVLLFLACLACALPVSAQHIVFTDTRGEMHNTGDFVPRFGNLPGNVLKVPAGQVVTLQADSTFDAIEVSGELKNDPTRDTVLRVSNLQVLPGGHLNLTVPCGKRLELIIRDTAINVTDVMAKTYDPFQWGTSVLNFGKVTIAGCALSKTFGPTAGDLHKGDTTIAFPDAASWIRPGDELLIPDTRQQDSFRSRETKNAPLREAKLTVTAVTGAVVTLSKSLDFDHLTISDFSGNVVLWPRVANLSRNVLIRSENPGGTLGHVAVLHGGTFDIRYAEFRNLGRTRNVQINSTNLDLSHVGTNQVGRYAFHIHHGQGFGSRFVGNALVGQAGGGKWCIAIHRSSDNTITDNVCADFKGSGIVTEEGSEVRNVIRHNFAAYIDSGPALDEGIYNAPMDNLTVNGVMALTKNPGGEGSCFWFMGVKDNTVDLNEGWNCRFGMVVMNHVMAGGYPSVPGGPLDTALVGRNHLFASFDRNVTAANLTTGLELWETLEAMVFSHHISANNYLFQIFQGQVPIDLSGGTIIDSTLLCHSNDSPVVNGIGASFAPGYAFNLAFVRTNVLGCWRGLYDGGGRNVMHIQGGTWQNELDFDFFGVPEAKGPSVFADVLIEGTTHLPYPYPRSYEVPAAAHGVHALSWRDQFVWLPTAETPSGPCVPNQRVVNWMGSGKTYCLVTSAAPPIVVPPPPPPPLPPPPPPPPPAPTATISAVRKLSSAGNLSTALTWTGVLGLKVDIFVNNKLLVGASANDGKHTHSIGAVPVGSTYVYLVCSHDAVDNCTAAKTDTVTR